MYKKFIRPLLFKFEPEKVHNFIFILLKLIAKLSFCSFIIKKIYSYKHPNLETEVLGIKFPNPVGLAGGFDKNAEGYNQLSLFGFGFVEIGSITPKAQEGNQSPRLFRLPEDKAIINRMGINNNGVIEVIKQVKKQRPNVILIANLAKNTISQDEKIAYDYDKSLFLLYDFVDMFVINLSCPNVKNMCNLQDVSTISDIMDDILDKRAAMDIYKPILLKISPDIAKDQVDDIIDYSLRVGIDGIVASNTSKNRNNLSTNTDILDKIGDGGLSGKPLLEKSIELVKYIHDKSEGRLTIIGLGGIMSGEDAKRMLDAGASLVEIYTGFIYEGPSIVKNILKYLVKNGYKSN